MRLEFFLYQNNSQKQLSLFLKSRSFRFLSIYHRSNINQRVTLNRDHYEMFSQEYVVYLDKPWVVDATYKQRPDSHGNMWEPNS